MEKGGVVLMASPPTGGTDDDMATFVLDFKGKASLERFDYLVLDIEANDVPGGREHLDFGIWDRERTDLNKFFRDISELIPIEISSGTWRYCIPVKHGLPGYATCLDGDKPGKPKKFRIEKAMEDIGIDIRGVVGIGIRHGPNHGGVHRNDVGNVFCIKWGGIIGTPQTSYAPSNRSDGLGLFVGESLVTQSCL